MKEIRGRDKFRKYKWIISFGSLCYGFLPRRIRLMVWNHISDKRGTLRIAQRYMLLKTLAKSVGENVSVFENVHILNPQNISIGDNVSIHPMSYLEGSGGIEIGDDVSIAHGVTIMSESHTYSDLDLPIKDQGKELQKVVIENNVWIGAKATILYGRHIASGSVIAASAVVTKDVSANSIVGGVPARLIKCRK